MIRQLAIALVVWVCFTLSGCNEQSPGSGIGAIDRLKWYFTIIPQDLEIERFYESPSPAMDHSYLWKIKIDGSKGYQQFEVQITGKPSNRDNLGVDVGLITDGYPRWWKNADLEKMEGYRFPGNENGKVFAMFDRESGYLFLQVHT